MQSAKLSSAEDIRIRRTLNQFLASTRKGYEQGGISHIARTSAIERVIQTVTHETPDKIDHLMREVVGDALSLSAGVSSQGGTALAAFSMMQAQALVSMRLDLSESWGSRPEIVQCSMIVQAHQNALIDWVVTGQYAHTHNASRATRAAQAHDMGLNLIAAQYLTIPELRIPLGSPFLACTAIFLSAIQMSGLWGVTPSPARSTTTTVLQEAL